MVKPNHRIKVQLQDFTGELVEVAIDEDGEPLIVDVTNLLMEHPLISHLTMPQYAIVVQVYWMVYGHKPAAGSEERQHILVKVMNLISTIVGNPPKEDTIYGVGHAGDNVTLTEFDPKDN